MYKNETHESFLVTKISFFFSSALLMFILCSFVWQCSCFVLHLLNNIFYNLFFSHIPFMLLFTLLFLVPLLSHCSSHATHPKFFIISIEIYILFL